MQPFGLALGAAVLTTVACRAGGSARSPLQPGEPFAVASVHLEQNATDGDVEVVFEVKGGVDGLASLTITGPDGRTVVAASSPDASTMGVRQIRFESPEPTDIERIRAAYPEGSYAFTATSTGGTPFAGQATLAHHLPPPATLLTPPDEAEDVAVASSARRTSIPWA